VDGYVVLKGLFNVAAKLSVPYLYCTNRYSMNLMSQEVIVSHSLFCFALLYHFWF